MDVIEKIKFMNEAIRLSRETMQAGKGGPFGCVVVKDGKIIARGANRVTSDNDPTAHAEIVAIRQACHVLGTFQLTGCTVFTSCEPCPMCLGAIYWARPEKVYYANTRSDAAAIGFDDNFIYEELSQHIHNRKISFEQVDNTAAKEAFNEWKSKVDKINY
jgi:guanine deaminase